MAESSNTRTYKVWRYGIDIDDGAEEVDVLIACGDYVAGDDRGAIRLAIKDHGFAHFVAVAESNWHEQTPKPDPEPRIKWSAA